MAAGLRLPDTYFDGLRADLAAKRDVLSAGLTDIGFAVLPSEGTYFVTTDIRPLGFTDGMEFCMALPERAGVAAIPHQFFCDDPEPAKPYVRWAFCKRQEVLREACDRLAHAFPG
jgi:N-succinyldiaminopimelate aminotransferase